MKTKLLVRESSFDRSFCKRIEKRQHWNWLGSFIPCIYSFGVGWLLWLLDMCRWLRRICRHTAIGGEIHWNHWNRLKLRSARLWPNYVGPSRAVVNQTPGIGFRKLNVENTDNFWLRMSMHCDHRLNRRSGRTIASIEISRGWGWKHENLENSSTRLRNKRTQFACIQNPLMNYCIQGKSPKK